SPPTPLPRVQGRGEPNGPRLSCRMPVPKALGIFFPAGQRSVRMGRRIFRCPPQAPSRLPIAGTAKPHESAGRQAASPTERIFGREPNMENEDFSDFFQALQEHEPQAYEQLIALCGPDIRAVIRCWLTEGPLRRVVDSVDVWQSILVKFDQCVQNGQFQA